MSENEYRREINNFRERMSKSSGRGVPRTTYTSGFDWYSVTSEMGLKLYFEMKTLYMKAFSGLAGPFKFHGIADPAGYGYFTPPITATELPFLESYNGKDGREGLGLSQTESVTITLTQLNNALATMNSGNFAGLQKDDQRLAVARVVIGIVEAARFKDVEDQIVAGQVILDRKWGSHANKAAVMIAEPS